MSSQVTENGIQHDVSGNYALQKPRSTVEEEQAEDRQLDEEPRVETPFRERPESLSTANDPRLYDRFLEWSAVLAMLVIFSVFGALARIGLTALASYSGQPVFPVAVAQAVGCAIMGIVARNRTELEQFYMPLYVGLGTGLCGSITTFSTWMVQVFQAFSNQPGYNHDEVRNVADAFTQLFITFAVASSGLRFGIHTSTLLRRWHLVPQLPEDADEKRQKPTTSQNRVHQIVIVFATLLWIGIAILINYKPAYRHVTFAILLAPFGTWLRFFLGRLLNTPGKTFPLGTFLANIIATALLAAFSVLQYSSQNRSLISCAALQGLDDGFCGCLSTVSTFATEIRGLKRFHAYRYAVISVLAGQAVTVLIFGSYWWSRGLETKCVY